MWLKDLRTNSFIYNGTDVYCVFDAMEEWKVIEGFENYSVSSEGRVRNDKTQLILKLTISKMGYLTTTVYSLSHKRKILYIHRLIATYFIDNPLKNDTVNHINGIKTDNSIVNLEWCTQKENCLHNSKIGTGIGETHSQAMLSEFDVLIICEMIKTMEIKDIALFFNANHDNIYRIVSGKIWKHLTKNLSHIPIARKRPPIVPLYLYEEIYNLSKIENLSYRKIALQYNISASKVCEIIKEKTQEINLRS